MTSLISAYPTPETLRAARAFVRWSIVDLADAAGLGHATVSRFELGVGGDPRLATLKALMEAFAEVGKREQAHANSITERTASRMRAVEVLPVPRGPENR